MVDEKSMLSRRTRALRERRGWTIAETARRAQLSTSMLWKVENGQTTLTYGKLLKLAAGLEVPVADLFSPVEATFRKGGRRVVNRKGSAPVVDFADNLHHFLATDIASKDFCPCLIEVDATTEESMGHAGEEFTYVLKGRVKFICEGYAPVLLEAGDSVYFDATLSHRYVREGKDSALILCVYSHTEDSELHNVPESEHGLLATRVRENLGPVGAVRHPGADAPSRKVAAKAGRTALRKRASA
ncbi:helix-turn-helix domain-containing protein [Sphingosinicella rhizophila]|uniref:XRE family transcriptional regulator n=1 Tax=Sphingosinicella rhizophila TaxID=3050082 RepID=A0ABU3Q454_9SPHN|nr:XRE family transcriptional regulator [Sphingosinicella sp. GR2756]MDT9598200.1 XRE family transcriptional regulator [Sphingosinicella sp. GR2756]